VSVPDARLSQLQQAITLYRRGILALDDKALTALQEAYGPSRERLLSLIESLVTQISADGTLTVTEAMQLGRARELLRRIEIEAGKLAEITGEIVPQAQQAAIEQAIERARVLTVAQAESLQQAAKIATQWTALNRDALTDLVGSLSDGSPLSDWIERVVPDAVQTVRDTLIDGVARGINPNDLARALSEATDLPLQRALTMARTETLNAYRSASIKTYQENDDILAGWTWIAAHDDRTCSACLAKSGQDFPLTVQFMPTHPRCRCSPAPKLKDDSLLPALQTGPEWFAEQPIDWQRQRFPVALRGDFDAGRVGIEDMAHLRRDDIWGDSYQTATIGQARANAKARLAAKTKPAALPKPSTTVKPYKPAKTLPDAERYAQSLGVPKATYREAGKRLDAGQTDAALNAANATNEAISILHSKGIPIPQDLRVLRDPYGKSAGAYAYYNPQNGSVTANSIKQFWRSGSNELNEAREAGYLVAENKTDVMIHEFGHFLQDMKGGLAQGRTTLTPEQEVIARQLSRYAATDQAEFVAETFVQLIRGRPVSDEVMKLYRAFGGYEP